MAYDARHKSIIAHAVALTGGNVAAAARWIAENSVECGEVSESTIRRLARDNGFTEMVAQSGKAITEEREEAARLAERARLKRDLQGTFTDRVREMEESWWNLAKRLTDRIDDPAADTREQFVLFGKLQQFLLTMKAHSAPAVADMMQAEMLIRAYQKVLMQKCGAQLTKQIQSDVGKEYQLTLTAEQAKAAEAANGPEETATAPGV